MFQTDDALLKSRSRLAFESMDDSAAPVRRARIDVWRVLHGARDVPAWMRESDN
jgi:plasmid stabilization system protein ParE